MRGCRVRKIVFWLLALTLTPRGVVAEDTAAVVAVLPDEAAECGYLLRRCQDVELAERRVVKNEQAMQEVRAFCIRAERDLHALLFYGRAVREYALSVKTHRELRHGTLKAAAAIRAKRKTVPVCFLQCPEILHPEAIE
jgi:hypothetical protein